MKKTDISHKKNKNRNLMLKIEYDGSAYSGWQRLSDNPRTIQETLERYLSEILKEEILVTGSGRTDTGVHALEQTANFFTVSPILTESLREELNIRLPKDIRILEVSDVDKSFHSRYGAVSKIYEYRIETGERQSVFTSRHCYFLSVSLDIKAMQKAAVLFIGEYDFRGFSTDRKDGKSTIRTIYDLKVYSYVNTTYCRPINEIRIQINGNGFLYNMVRIIAGTLIEVGEGKRRPESIKEILESGKRELAGMTAQPQGLYLVKVRYQMPKSY